MLRSSEPLRIRNMQTTVQFAESARGNSPVLDGFEYP